MANDNNRIAVQRARGLGAAKIGVDAWRWQRVTAVALVPLVVWSLASLIGVVGDGREAVVGWLVQPGSAIPMMLLLIVLFWHMALGLAVVAEDYLHHSGVRMVAVAIIQLVCLALGVTGVVASALAMLAG